MCVFIVLKKMREKGSTKYTKNAYSFKSWPRSNSSSNSSTEYSEKRKKM